MKLERGKTVNDRYLTHPLAGTMALTLHTFPTIYVHDIRGAPPVRYGSLDGAIQGCPMGIPGYCISQENRSIGL